MGASFATPTGQTLGAGIVQLYERDGADWMRGQELFASNATAFATFGASMALHGDVLLISAFREDGGGAGVDPAPGAAMQSDSGAVYLFERAGPGEPFVEQLRIKAQVPGENANYGHDLALVDDTLVVGAPLESSAATGVDGSQGGVGSPESGAVYVVR